MHILPHLSQPPPCKLTHIFPFPLITKDSLSQLLSKSDSPNCTLHPTLFCLLKSLFQQSTLLFPASSVFPLNWIIPIRIQIDSGENPDAESKEVFWCVLGCWQPTQNCQTKLALGGLGHSEHLLRGFSQGIILCLKISRCSINMH